MACVDSVSKVVAHLEPVSRVRYLQKLEIAGVTDPYDLPSHLFTPIEKQLKFDRKMLPELCYPDIFHYLVDTTSSYTMDSMKAFKSLESYKYFVAGWVHGMQTWSIPGKQRVLVMSKVCHSQRLGDPPLRPWLSIQLDGQVMCAHCTCMAGVGEACSHIGATLFALATTIELLQKTTCTSTPCEWLRPSAQKIEYAQGSDIEFISPKRKLKRVRCTTPVCERACKEPTGASLVPPTAAETTSFYDALAACDTRCSVLSVISPYCEAYIPRAVTRKLPSPLPDTFLDENFVQANDFCALKTKCAATFASMSITSEEATAIELETRGQSSTNTWFQHRAGRITASNFKAAVRTQTVHPDHLSASLIKRICYPASHKFSSAATSWGCNHESDALAAYTVIAKSSHTSFTLRESPGLHINPRYPHLGASPDGVVHCECHGNGIVEVKCPYCKRNDTIEDAADDPRFCLEKCGDGSLSLKRSHEYFYQVQCQLFVTGMAYCDFVVYTSKDNLFVQRHVPDTDFWCENISVIDKFYLGGILPELIGKLFTRAIVHTSDLVPGELICYCRKPATATDMLNCCNTNCKVKQYHRQCLGLKTVPKRAWRCPDCRKLLKKSTSVSSV